MLLLLFFLESTFFFLSNVVALNITVQSDTIVGLPSLVLWAREPSDGNGLFLFDLRFVKPDNEDIGLALANIQVPPSTQFGTVQVVFSSPGSYLLVAVRGADFTEIGKSGQVNAFQVPTTSLTTSTSQPTPSTTSSATPTTTTSGARLNKNLGAIIGGTLGGVAFLGLIAALMIFFLRRRQSAQNKRWTFHRDKMIRPPILDIRRFSPMDSQFFSSQAEDIEHQGFRFDDSIPFTTSPVQDEDDTTTNIRVPTITISPSSPSRPKPIVKFLHRPLPLPPDGVSLEEQPHHQDSEDVVEELEEIGNQITELERRSTH
jgi:hypothetical protein